MHILHDILVPTATHIEQLLASPPTAQNDRAWANDFCRRLALLKSSLTGFASLVGLPCEEPAGDPTTDRFEAVPEFVDFVHKCKTGTLLPDADDPRHKAIRHLHQRIGRLLHEAANRLKQVGSDDSFDSVKMLMCAATDLLYRTASRTYAQCDDTRLRQ
jgi:proteasome activator subunit 4